MRTCPTSRTWAKNDVAILIGFAGATIGWLAGLGFLAYPLSAALGRPPSDGHDRHAGGPWRSCASTDHKVIGLQYLAGIGVFFFIGGLNAMLIRTELLSPSAPVFSPGQIPHGGHAARHDDDHDDVVDHRWPLDTFWCR